MENFRELRDAAKINKKPQRIRLKTVATATTLEQALRNYGVSAARLNEISILNGMLLTDRVASGTMIKIIGE
jgi:predicted Zn-dependent protease